jgi:hypothetical protein
MQHDNDCDPAAIWWGRRPQGGDDERTTRFRRLSIPPARPGFALFLCFVPVLAWLFARDQRQRVAAGELRDVGRRTLAFVHAYGAVITSLLVATLFVLVVESAR